MQQVYLDDSHHSTLLGWTVLTNISPTRITDFVSDKPKVHKKFSSATRSMTKNVKFISGYCCIQWMVCSDTYSFNFNSAGSTTFAIGTTGTACPGDYLMIPRNTGLHKLRLNIIGHCVIHLFQNHLAQAADLWLAPTAEDILFVPEELLSVPKFLVSLIKTGAKGLNKFVKTSKSLYPVIRSHKNNVFKDNLLVF